MRTERPRTPRVLVGVAGLSALAATCLMLAALTGRRHHTVALSDDEPAQEVERATEKPLARATPAYRPSSTIAKDDGASRRAEEQHKASVLLDGVRLRMLNIVPNPEEMGIESVGNAMQPYLHGALSTLRAVDPALIGALRDNLVERTCDHQQSDVELMLTAHMVQTDPELGASKIFDCALRGRKKEDVVLWTLLDAWKLAGRPASEVASSVAAFATDPRTVGRLSGDDTLARQQIAERATVAAENQPPPQTVNRKEIGHATEQP